MGMMASEITSLAIVYSTIYLVEDQRKHQTSVSLAFVWGIHRRPVNSPHKWSVTRKMFPFDDVIMHCLMLKIKTNKKQNILWCCLVFGKITLMCHKCHDIWNPPQQLDWLYNSSFQFIPKKTSELCITSFVWMESTHKHDKGLPVMRIYKLNFSEGTKHIFTCDVTLPHWHGTCSLNHFPFKTRTYLFCTVKILGADVLVTQWARA